MRLVELIRNITYNRKTTSIEPQFWSGELFSRFGWPCLSTFASYMQCTKPNAISADLYIIRGLYAELGMILLVGLLKTYRGTQIAS
jgi:hypothetical protein